MATITVNANPHNNVGKTAYQAHLLQYTLQTAANGGALAGTANSVTAIASGDVVNLGVIPAGSLINDACAVVSTAFTASVTGTLGFAYVDGVDSTEVPQDADYFMAAAAINTAGVYRKTNTTAPVTLPKDAFLTLTTGGAANAKVARIDVTLVLNTQGVA